MWAYFIDYCKKIKSRNFGCNIYVSIQINRAIRIIQRNLSIKSALFVFSVQCDIFISISAIIYRSNQSFQFYGRQVVSNMPAMYIQIESNFSQFLIIQ